MRRSGRGNTRRIAPPAQAHDDPYRDWEAKNPKQLIERLLDKALATPAPLYAADVRSAIEAVAPDTVVCSQFAIGAMVGAESTGIPFDVLMPNIYLCPVPGLPPFGLGLKPAKSVLGRGRDRALNSLIARMWDKGLARINALRSEYGLAPIAHFWDQIHHARRELVLDLRRVRLPGPVAGQRSLRRRATRRPGVGRALRAPGRRRTARARRDVVDVPGSCRQLAARRRRARAACR